MTLYKNNNNNEVSNMLSSFIEEKKEKDKNIKQKEMSTGSYKITKMHQHNHQHNYQPKDKHKFIIGIIKS